MYILYRVIELKYTYHLPGYKIKIQRSLGSPDYCYGHIVGTMFIHVFSSIPVGKCIFNEHF